MALGASYKGIVKVNKIKVAKKPAQSRLQRNDKVRDWILKQWFKNSVERGSGSELKAEKLKFSRLYF